MTKLLERAFAAASSRPDAEQDALAALILDEIADERQWDRQFAATSDKQWDSLAAMARRDIAASGSASLDEFIQSHRG